MLKFLRKNTKTIIWTVIIAFVAWGGYAVSVQFQEASRSPGRIFGKEVSYRDYLSAGQAVRIFSPPPEKGQEQLNPEEIEARTWQFLMLSHEARERKIVVSDEEVRDEIVRFLKLRPGDLLTPNAYLRWVRNTLREEPREFEHQVREQVRIRKLLAQVRQGLGEKPERKLRRWLTNLFRHAQLEVYRKV